MARSLLHIPPELLVHILSFLPIQPLLKFSQTCRVAHQLASSSLHTLSLGIHPTRISCIIARLASMQYPEPKETRSFFSTPSPPSPATAETSRSSSRETNELALTTGALLPNYDPYKVSVLIPDAQAFDYMTLLTFHTALTSSILFRHGATLRNLDLSLWTLTMPIAKALAGLPALQALSLRIEDFPHVRSVSRHRVAMQRIEEREAWNFLTSTALWAPRLHALRIEGGELNAHQLSTLLTKSPWCRELWLCKCSMIDNSFWAFLGNEWEGRTALRILSITRCCGQLNENVLDIIGTLVGLQFLSLHDCHGVDSEIIERRNTEDWGIRECIPPQPLWETRDGDVSAVIEVDPEYLDDDE